MEFKEIPSIDRTLANRYGQDLEDVRQWLGVTRWSQGKLSGETVLQVQERLLALDLIQGTKAPETFLWP